MKYEAEIDLRNHNTSHALLVELVGPGRRVLDVGCAGGDLGRMLKRRGCRVSGVELDPQAGEAARQVLDDVVLGDATELDLVGHFGRGNFDVVVFGDVLEHVADPAALLRKVGPLLDPAGSVVASIPNVAHGSVRLALLQGRFDYRSLGLLDATHLRFFTRGSVHELFREAGLVPVDMRRTTAGVFDTEVPLRREDFDEGVVDAVVGDPDSTTYQFVLRAVPEASQEASGGADDGAAAPPATARCRVGIWGHFEPDDLRHALVLRVTASEIARRVPGAAIRSFTSSGDARPSPHDGGLPVEALGHWSSQRAAALAAELDCVVIAGDLPDPGDAERDGGRIPARFVVEGLGHDAGEPGDVCPVVWSAVRLPAGLRSAGAAGADPGYRSVLEPYPPDAPADAAAEALVTVPDPLLLVPRLLRAEALARRLEFVRIMGWFPVHGPAVALEVGGGLLPHAAAVARALDAMVSATGAGVVLVQTRPDDQEAAGAADAIAGAMAGPVHRVPVDALVDDMVAVVANATALAACSASGAALGLAYNRPMAYVDFAGDPSLGHLAEACSALGAVVTRPGELAALLDGERFTPTAGVVAKMQLKLDAHFDRIAAIADAAAASHPRAEVAGPLLPPSEYVSAVERAHRRMQERLDAERRAVADHLGNLRRSHESLAAERDALAARVDATALGDGREADLRHQRDDAVAQLEALQGIRVLRMLRPVRAVYARLRGSRL